MKQDLQPRMKQISQIIIVIMLMGSSTILAKKIAVKKKVDHPRLKKLVILPINNVENKPAYGYLEASITEAIKKMIKKQFAYKGMSKYSLNKLLKENFIFKKDFHTQTASMAVGLIGKLDVVISGSYKIVIKNKESIIVTDIAIYDIRRKKVISKFTMRLPADNRIWSSIEKIAKRITTEAKSVLPNKKEWLRKGYKIFHDRAPIFHDFSLGFSSGLSMYYFGYASDYETKQPAFALNARWNMPILFEGIFFQLETSYVKHKMKKKSRTAFSGTDITIENYIPGFYCGYDFKLLSIIYAHPRFGGGYFFQNIEMTGFIEESYSNSFPFIAGAVDFSLRINDKIKLILTPIVYWQIENKNTMLGTLSAGISLKL